MASPSIFDYSDYRTFLRDSHQARKAKRPRWSLGSWTRRLGLNSPSTLTMILRGQRHPGPELIAKLAQDLQLNPSEVDYFYDLVQLQRNTNDLRFKELIKERLARLRSKNAFSLPLMVSKPLCATSLPKASLLARRFLAALDGLAETAKGEPSHKIEILISPLGEEK